MAFRKIGTVRVLPPGEMAQVTVGEQRYAVCNVDGVIHAIEGVCPHRQGPLGEGALHGHSVVCPWHAWEFDCRTGENDRDPAINVKTVAARVEGDDILIDVP